MNAPPPVASTCGLPASIRAITRRSPSRKWASPNFAKISEIVMLAARSISSSASAKAMPSRIASRRPIVDLPDPIRPTSTIDRSRIAAGIGPGAAEAGLFGFRDMLRAAIPTEARGTIILLRCTEDMGGRERQDHRKRRAMTKKLLTLTLGLLHRLGLERRELDRDSMIAMLLDWCRREQSLRPNPEETIHLFTYNGRKSDPITSKIHIITFLLNLKRSFLNDYLWHEYL